MNPSIVSQQWGSLYGSAVLHTELAGHCQTPKSFCLSTGSWGNRPPCSQVPFPPTSTRCSVPTAGPPRPSKRPRRKRRTRLSWPRGASGNCWAELPLATSKTPSSPSSCECFLSQHALTFSGPVTAEATTVAQSHAGLVGVGVGALFHSPGPLLWSLDLPVLGLPLGSPMIPFSHHTLSPPPKSLPKALEGSIGLSGVTNLISPPLPHPFFCTSHPHPVFLLQSPG